jgi:hypothetical protein
MLLSSTEKSLRGVDVLAIANALAEHNVDNWFLPTPSTFTKKEIEAVRRWGKGGGSLFLVADHMPWPGAAKKLAAAFGVRMLNGFAMNEKAEDPNSSFIYTDGRLAMGLDDAAYSRWRMVPGCGIACWEGTCWCIGGSRDVYGSACWAGT